MYKVKKCDWWLGFAISAIICMLYATLSANKTMPISEGWYTEYAWLINHGQLPYRDFEYLFFPLYIYFIALFTRLFGYNIIALRFLGVVVFGAIGAALYGIFSKISNSIIGAIAAITTALYLQSEVVQLYYDYIRFHDLFAFITVWLLICLSEKCFYSGKLTPSESKDKISQVFCVYIMPAFMMLLGIWGVLKNPPMQHYKRAFVFGILVAGAIVTTTLGIKNKRKLDLLNWDIWRSGIFTGIFVSLECMVKQSNGILMIAMILVYLLFCGVSLRKSRFFMAFWGWLCGLMLAFGVMLSLLLASNSFDGFVRCCFKKALGAKGGLANTLFRWILISLKSLVLQWKFVALFALCIYLPIEIWNILRKKNSAREKAGYTEKHWIALVGIMFAMLEAIVVFVPSIAGKLYRHYDTSLPVVCFWVCTFMFFGYAFYLIWIYIKKAEVSEFASKCFPCFSVLGGVFAQGYGSGMSGGLCESQTALAVGFLVCVTLLVAIKAHLKEIVVCIVAMLIFFNGTFEARKYIESYSWWGLTQGSLIEHTEVVNVPLLNGIRVRQMDKECYETVYSDVVNNTTEEDKIFTFPHCPIMYTITNRHSDTYTKVQWFDVSSTDSIHADMELLRNDMPKVIVYANVPDFVYEGHESSFSAYQTREMREFILNELVPEHYDLLHTVDIGNGFSVSTYVLK